MKTQFLTLITFMVTSAIAFSCKKEELISYEDALRNCKKDTMVQVINNDTIKTYRFPESSILGAQLPIFESIFMDGQPITADYFANKINVINFWFIGCHPCEAEMPGFNALIEKYKSQPVNFLAISRNKPDDLHQFFAEHPFNMDQIALGESVTRDIFHMSWAYPMTIVADANYKIIYAKSGGMADNRAVQNIQDELIPVIDGALKKM